jgi:Spy/CpxP family protein refolding chaperone
MRNPFSVMSVSSAGSWSRAIFASLLLLASATSLVTAQRPGEERRARGRWWTNPQVIDRLGLTEGQVAKIDEIAFGKQQELIELRADKRSAQLEMQRLLASEEPDRAALESEIERLSRADCAISSLEIRARADIALVLDPQQRSALTRRFRRWEEQRRSRGPGENRMRMTEPEGPETP